MKHFILNLAFACLIFSSQTYAEENLDTKLANYRTNISELTQNLKAELMAAMKIGGPISGLEKCNTKAPRITTDFSKKVGFTTTRTSLKPRNTANAPLKWQKVVLDEFKKRKAKGENPNEIEFHEVVTVNGQRQLRYMKAIPTADKCLICHGENIAPSIQAKIKQLYPNDKATGFKLGDLRGAFVITENVDDE